MLLGGIYAADGLTPGQVYDMPVAQAANELASMPLPKLFVQATTGTDATAVQVRRSGETIGWHFQVRGEDVAVFTARLSAEGANKTRVRVSFTPGEPLSPELGRLTSTRLMRDLAAIAMSEQVDAQLEHRPFDPDDTVEALARHAAAHPELVREYGLAVGGMFNDIHSQIQENSPEVTSHAISQAPPGLDKTAMDAATRPSVVPPIN